MCVPLVTVPARKPARMWDCLHGLQFPSWYLSLLWPGLLPELQCECLLHCGLPWAVEPQPAPLWSSPQAAGQSLLQDLEHVLPLSWCLKGCFSHFLTPFSQLLLWFLLFLKYVFAEAPPAQLASSGPNLEVDGTGLFSKNHPCYQNLVM